MAQDTNKKMVVAQCDPYNARFHHNDERVLEYDITTPVKWVMEDDYGYGLSEEEALAKLEAYASEDGYEYFDEESLAEYVKMVKEDFEVEDVDTSWYEGRGYYDSENNVCVYLCGDHYYRHDTMFYSIEDFVAEEKEEQRDARR